MVNVTQYAAFQYGTQKENVCITDKIHETQVPSPDGRGWTYESENLTPLLMSLEPVPISFLALVSCSIKKGCSSKRSVLISVILKVCAKESWMIN